VSPTRLFRTVALAEAVTWAGLLTGMVLKYGTETTELGVRVFGMLHGVVFIAYCLTTLVVAVDRRWSAARTAVGLLSAVPPFMTVWFDRHVESRGALGDSWRLLGEDPVRPAERPVAWLLRNPLRGALAAIVAVAALTGVALLVGPPAG
jgi:integral membrane protein